MDGMNSSCHVASLPSGSDLLEIFASRELSTQISSSKDFSGTGCLLMSVQSQFGLATTYFSTPPTPFVVELNENKDSHSARGSKRPLTEIGCHLDFTVSPKRVRTADEIVLKDFISVNRASKGRNSVTTCQLLQTRLDSDKKCSLRKERICFGKKNEFSDTVADDDSLQGPLNCIIESGELMSSTLRSPLRIACQVDGASDEFEQSTVKEKLSTNDNRMSLDVVQQPLNPARSQTMPFFGQFGENTYGASSYINVPRTMLLPVAQNMLHVGSAVPRFGTSASSSMFHLTQTAPMPGPGGIFCLPGNAPGFSTASELPTSQHACLPSTYAAQRQTGGGTRWNVLEQQNSSIPQHYPSYSNSFLWRQGMSGQESMDHCLWPSYRTQQQQLLQQQHQLRSNPNVSLSPGRGHASGVGLHHISQPQSAQGSDMCLDMHHSPGTSQSRNTPLGTSPAEKPPSVSHPLGDLLDNARGSSALQASEHESRISLALSSSHHLSYPLISDQLSQGTQSSRELGSKLPNSQMLSSKTPQMQMSQELLTTVSAASLPLSQMGMDVPAFPVNTTQPRFPSSSSLLVHRYAGFENRFQHPPGIQESSHSIWSQQLRQNVPSTATNFSGNDRAILTMPRMHQVVRKPFCYPQMASHRGAVPFPMAQRFPPPAGSGSVVLTDLLQQHSMMQQRSWMPPGPAEVASSHVSQTGAQAIIKVTAASDLPSSIMSSSHLVTQSVKSLQAERAESTKSESCSYDFSLTQGMSERGVRTPSVTTTTDFRPDAEVHLSTPVQKSPSAATKTLLKMETTERLDAPVNCVVTTVAVRSMELCSLAGTSTVAVTCCVSSSLQSASDMLISAANPAVLSAKNGEVEEDRFRSSARSQSSPGCSTISSAKVPGGSASVGNGNSENMEHTNYSSSSSSQPTSLPRLSGGSDSILRSTSALSSQHSISSLVQAPRDLSHQPFMPGFPLSKSDQVFQDRIVSSPSLQSPNLSAQQDAEAMAMNSQMYQDWLMQRDNSLAEEIKCLELQVAQRRKTKKSLMAKQRTAQKSGRELSEDDIRRLSETGDEQTRLQQQLYQCRKDARSHQSKVQEFRLKTVGQGIPDAQQLPIAEVNQERSLDRMQQFACSSQTEQGFPNEVPTLGKHMTSPVEMLHQPLKLNTLPQPQGSVSKFPLHPEQPCHQYRVQSRFFPPESSREMQFLPGQVPDASFRPWLKGESGMRFPCPSGSGMMPPDPAGVAMQNLVNSRQNATGFALLSNSNFDRPGAKDSERLNNSCGAYTRTDDGQDRASQQSHFTADTSRRAIEDHTHPQPLLFGAEAQDVNKSPFLEPHKMTGEQGKCMTLAQVRLLSRMTESMLTSAKDPNYSSIDGDRPIGHLSGYELKSDCSHPFSLPGQKPVKRGSFSEGDKITRKRIKRPSTDIFSRDETLHQLLPDYETHLTQLFKQLEKLGPLSLTEPDVPMLETSVPLYKGSEKSLSHEENASSIVESQKWKSSSLISPPSLSSPMQPSNQVSVTVTLSRSVANDIASVVSAIADMLKVATPAKFEIDSESCIQAAEKKKWRTVQNALLYEEQAVNLQSLVRARTKFCRHCALPFDSGRVKKEDPFNLEKDGCEEGDHDATFCSMHCSLESVKACHTATVSSAMPSGNHCLKLGSASLNKQDAVSDGRMKTILSQISVKLEKEVHGQQRLLQSPCHELKEAKQERLVSPEKRTVKARKWENIHYKRWSVNLIKSKDRQKLTVLDKPNKSVPELHEDNFCGIVADSKIPDLRKCAFCLTTGDAATDGPGRLLNMDFDVWVHVNCALWSSEVYETMDGTLMNVVAGYNRGQTLDCVGCAQKGATITCYRNRCTNSYHLECARNDGVTFLENKTCYCRLHCPKCPPAAVLKSMSVYRKVAVDRDENRLVANMLRVDDIESCRMRIGSLVIQNIGQLLPYQIQSGNFNTEDYLYPVGFKSTRYYWNYQQVHSRCRYVCKIIDVNSKPSFVIKVKEPGRDDAIFMDSTCTGVWVKILKAFEQLRHSEVLTSFFTDYIHGEDLYGLTEPAIQRVIESMSFPDLESRAVKILEKRAEIQLPGVELLGNFKFRFGKSSLYVFPLAINPTGCVRSEPKTKTFLKRSHTLLSSFKVHSSSSGSALLGSGEFNIQQYMKQFTHTKPQRYRSLKTEWRNNVYLRRSNIQGLGLFAARQLEQYTMVIEYIGQLIRNELCEIREKIYEQQNRGIYMFRIDENVVIDATMAGGPARYINHSCDPNCFTEIIPTERGNKIVITALRKINSGEELTYDYKFDLEDDKKIPCLCGAAKCQKWMN